MKREVTPATIQEVRRALNAWHSTSDDGLMVGWRLVQQELKRRPHTFDDVAVLRSATNQILYRALKRLEQQSSKHATTIRLRSLDKEVEQLAAASLGVSIPTMYRYQRDATKALTQILVAQEQTLYTELVEEQLAELPQATYKQLFGITEKQSELVNTLCSAETFDFALICGIGGIGKTSLIRAVTKQLIEQLAFKQIIWIEITYHGMREHTQTNVVQQVLDQLARKMETSHASEQQIKQWFRQQSVLLIIDNVEAVQDAANVWRMFHSWTTNSKIIVTSRARPTSLQNVHVTSLDELSMGDSLTMIRHLATLMGQPDLTDAADAQLKPIYDRTGGNPQAIKIVMGLAATRPLQMVLDDLPQAKRGETEALYRHIYWRAWRSLSPDAKTVFKAMRWAAETNGTTAEHIQALADLEGELFWHEVEALIIRSLLLQIGTTFAPRYAIHRLSAQFLQEQVLKW